MHVMINYLKLGYYRNFAPSSFPYDRFLLRCAHITDVDGVPRDENVSGLYAQSPENLLEINPETAAGLGILDGDTSVRLCSNSATIKASQIRDPTPAIG